MVDLDKAVMHYRGSLELRAPGHRDRPRSLNILAAALGARFDRTGQMVDLEEAILHTRGALALCPPGHPDRSGSLNNLAVALETRFNHTGQMVDLDEAVMHYRGSIELRPPGHPDHIISLDNLAGALKARFDRTGQMVDLEESLLHTHNAVELRPPGHRNHCGYPNNLTVTFQNHTEARNVEKFVMFISLIINDVNYLTDESLNELTQICNIQTDMEDTDVWAATSVQHRREREGTLRQLERHPSGYITLWRSTVELLKGFTAATKAPFVMPGIVDRLAATLDYNLDALVGPKCNELKVKDPARYGFKPKELLSDTLQVFLNLSDQEEFVLAVAGDGRSYKWELFERAVMVIRRRAIKTEPQAQQLLAFVAKVEEAKLLLGAEDDLGEIPHEFIDPLVATVMHDPVLLPSSKIIIDRSTITSHLLSDSKDPFNRAPLSIQDVVSDPELKARIQEFLVERRKNKMDVTE
ncbi:U-box-domain-containing protein [Athelia psychrophila]|uniref:RING-type E3 ubiquitin transferase n=1 Tax=Athelia psychrophila TaxID=1759441 RepID=A0A166UDB6_9AGAM|nr:U-box-domain-containing protein [Fibularhizoctonia sp. CBS 109695]